MTADLVIGFQAEGADAIGIVTNGTVFPDNWSHMIGEVGTAGILRPEW